MGLRFVNHYSMPLSVVIMFKSPETCAGEGKGWEQMGWWNINRGQSALVYANDLDNVSRWWYYYAHAADGAQWKGDGRWVAAVPKEAFNLCWGLGISGPPLQRVDYVQLDIHADNHTHTLF